MANQKLLALAARKEKADALPVDKLMDHYETYQQVLKQIDAEMFQDMRSLLERITDYPAGLDDLEKELTAAFHTRDGKRWAKAFEEYQGRFGQGRQEEMLHQ